MNVLVDTHVLLWLAGYPERLSARASALLADPDNRLFVSAASLWEISIKAGSGKMRGEASDIVEDIRAHGMFELPITFEHAKVVRTLPAHHKDPFDRMLIAQALVEQLTIVTADRIFRLYAAPLVSA